MIDCLDLPALDGAALRLLRTLKRALALTCLLLVPHMRDGATAVLPDDPPTDAAVDVADAPPAATAVTPETPATAPGPSRPAEPDDSSAPTDSSADAADLAPAEAAWSDRLAVQISAANRNFSTRAKRRRELYHLSRRRKLLRRSDGEGSSSGGGPPESPPPAPLAPFARRRRREDTSGPPRPSTSRDAPYFAARAAAAATAASDAAAVAASAAAVAAAAAAAAAARPSPSPAPAPTRPDDFDSMRSFRFRIRNLARMGNRPMHIPASITDNLNNILEEVATRAPPGASAADSRDRSDADAPPLRRMPRFQFFIGGARGGSADAGRDPSAPNDVPLVRINDVPVNDFHQRINYIPYGRDAAHHMQMNNIDVNHGIAGLLDISPGLVAEASCPVHRIQVWDITNEQMPDISNAEKNIVVEKCKIHNDASIDVSRDGRLIVALLPAQRFRSNRLGIYSLEWGTLGQCLYTAMLEQNPVSVALSPCGQHLAVGLASRRVTLIPSGRSGVMAVIFKLVNTNVDNEESYTYRNLVAVRNLEQFSESSFTSINCLRWAPQPGQGLVYANNTGQLRILS